MGDQATNAVVAMALGTVVAVVLLAPTAAYQYRLDGRLQPKDLAVLLGGAVYGLALWTYTLLPMPAPGTYRCKAARLDPTESLRQIGQGPDLLRDPAFQQVALNVLLFVPLGYLLRVIARRGVVVATLAGAGTSLLVEVTQRTGVWGVYDCAYRQFDTLDLVVNTLGAVGGSLLAFVFLDRRDDSTPPLPTTISLGRRVVGMLSDVLFGVVVGGAVAAVYRGWGLHGPGAFDRDVQTALLFGVPLAVEVVSVVVSGRSVGDHVVAVRPAGPRAGSVPERLLTLFVGLVPVYVVALLATTTSAWVALLLVPLGAVHVVAAWRTEQHRGLTHAVAGLDLRIAAEERIDA